MSNSITILHERAPQDAQPWTSFQMQEPGVAILINAEEISEEKHTPDICDARRYDILLRALKYVDICPVILYTGTPTSDQEAPCGCYGYDSVCDYHRNHDCQVAECFCCAEKNVSCSYHLH